MKQLKVDVKASLGFQANGRVKPAEKKDLASISVKEFVCPECNASIKLSKSSFGETVLCTECKIPMYQVTA